VLALLALGYLGVGLAVASRITAPRHEPPEATPGSAGLAYSEVAPRSTDGVRLAAWWVPEEEATRAAVLVHGWGGDRSNRNILETAAVYHRAGYAVLMLDLRGHGESAEERQTFGYREARDVRGALRWLEEEGFGAEDVVLHGWSMGGATVIRSAPGTGVAAVVAEATYADLPTIVRQRLPEVSGVPTLFAPGAMLSAKLFLGADPWRVDPAEDAAKLREENVPLLIIHSEDDEVVAFEHAARLLDAYPDASLWRLEGYGHVEAYRHPEYPTRLLEFLDRIEPREAA
jgi:fermentation-respiration switch protein FrsA (DUF1100 family)